MNKAILMGRLTRDPETRYTQGENPTAVARYTLAVDRGGKRENGDQADFISCVAFRGPAEFAEKYLRKGMKIAVVGRIQTGSYKNKDGNTVYTTDVVVSEHYFCESRENNGNTAQTNRKPDPELAANGFMNIPDGMDDELPFN